MDVDVQSTIDALIWDFNQASVVIMHTYPWEYIQTKANYLSTTLEENPKWNDVIIY
jgi:hypothetical protein